MDNEFINSLRGWSISNYPNEGVNSKCVVPGGSDNIITGRQILLVLMEMELREVLLETLIVTRAIEANISTVEVISDVCKVLL